MDVFKISVPNGIEVGTFDNTRRHRWILGGFVHALDLWCERYRSGTGARQSDRSGLWIKTRSALRLYFARSAPLTCSGMTLVLLKWNGETLMKWLSDQFWRCCSCVYDLIETADAEITASVTRASVCVVKENVHSFIQRYDRVIWVNAHHIA